MLDLAERKNRTPSSLISNTISLEGAKFAFDYSDMAKDARILAQTATIRIRRLSAEHIRDVGAQLSQVKAAMEHGDWMPWLSAEFTFTDRTAQNYMAVGEWFADADLDALSRFDKTALYALASPDVPDSAREEALERVATGERITQVVANAIINDRFVSASELEAVVRSWLKGEQRFAPAEMLSALEEIRKSNAVGSAFRERLNQFVADAFVQSDAAWRQKDLNTAIKQLVDQLKRIIERLPQAQPVSPANNGVDQNIAAYEKSVRDDPQLVPPEPVKSETVSDLGSAPQEDGQHLITPVSPERIIHRAYLMFGKPNLETATVIATVSDMETPDEVESYEVRLADDTIALFDYFDVGDGEEGGGSKWNFDRGTAINDAINETTYDIEAAESEVGRLNKRVAQLRDAVSQLVLLRN